MMKDYKPSCSKLIASSMGDLSLRAQMIPAILSRWPRIICSYWRDSSACHLPCLLKSMCGSAGEKSKLWWIYSGEVDPEIFSLSWREASKLKTLSLLLIRPWMLGRITKVMPDSWGIVQIAEVQTQMSTIQRPIIELCLLQGEEWKKGKTYLCRLWTVNCILICKRRKREISWREMW